MTRLSARVRNVAPSPTFAIKAKAQALARAGRSIIDLSAGEPDFLPPPLVGVAAVAAVQAGANRYAPVAGMMDLREAVADRYRGLGLDVQSDQVLVTHGGKQALYNLAQTLLDPGDEAVVLTPAWVSYIPQIELAGGRAVCVPCDPEAGFLPDPDRVAAALTERTRFVLLNSPANPTGAVIDEERLRAIDAAAAAVGAVVISDELYRAITFDEPAVCHPLLADPSLERTVIVDAVSKTWAMTGWRVGFMLGPRDLVKAATKIQSHSTSGVCRINEAGALAALTGPQDFLGPVIDALRVRRDTLVAGLAAIPGISLDVVPSGAFYLFPRVNDLFGRRGPDGKVLENAGDVAAALLELGGVAMVPGEGFGESRCVRMSYATKQEDIESAVTRLASAVSQLG
ncbi:MAG: pyridoxal phosphate-dependent aminotransferase [Deltaproteobacteria bacterium]|nr:pyridoxal phosphate-dependent aminotransferase [Deltaproteobacteria bacterium]